MSILNTGSAHILTQRQSDAAYAAVINECLEHWRSFLDLSTRSVGMFTLVMMTYIDAIIDKFFDEEKFPKHAALVKNETKKMMRNVQLRAADLRRTCAPQRNTEFWPADCVSGAIGRYNGQGVAHDINILWNCLVNHFHGLKLEIPEPLLDLYFCICLVRVIDINVDIYSRALIKINPLFADILNLPLPSADTAAKGQFTPLHLLANTDTKLHLRLKQTDPQYHRELSHRRFARTRDLRLALSKAATTFYGPLCEQLPDSGILTADKNYSNVGLAAVVLLRRANKTEFIRRATEPNMWAEFDAIEQDYIGYLDDNDLDHSLDAAHAWKLQSEKCGEHVAAVGAVNDWKNGERQDAAAWLDICTDLEEQWAMAEAATRQSFDIEREATAKLNPTWTPEKVERAVSEIQYGIHEVALMYDLEALRYHLDKQRPKGVTKKALRHEVVQRKKR